MESLLYLAHRLPYPPNKGDKVRSFNILRHLSSRYRVHLGCFVDYAEDMPHVPALAQWCTSSHVERIHPTWRKLTSLRGLLTGEALTLPYYRSAGMQRWVDDVVEQEGITRAVVFSSAMAQYVLHLDAVSSIVDFCDVDSAKWTEYGRTQAGPLGWIHAREGRRLLEFERSVSSRATASVFVSKAEADLFVSLAPEAASRVVPISNGVDAIRFAPDPALPNPFADGEQALVFTGAMDYKPNIDAVVHFVQAVWPALATERPNLSFWIVGMNPSSAVRELAGTRVRVTGTVDDVRPYLQHAALVVAPLLIARGIQNKVLEAMAMGRAVVCSSDAAEGIVARRGVELSVAADPLALKQCISDLLDCTELAGAMGRAARERVLADYSWDVHLSRLDSLFERPAAETRMPAVACA